MSLFYGYKKDTVETIGSLPTTGGEMTGDLNMNDNHILTSADPTEASHLARKKYVDNLITNHTGVNYLAKTGGVMTGNIDMGNNKITTTANPVSDKDLARKKYVDDQDSKKLSVTGGVMSGNIIMGNNKIQTTADPTGDKDLSRKKYVDTQDAKKLSLTGGTMSGNINMGGNKIQTMATSFSNNEMVSKEYIDGNFLGKTKESYKGVSKDTLKDLYIKNFQIFCKQNPNQDDSLVRKKYIFDNFVEMEKVSWLGKDRSKIKRDIYTDQHQVLTSKDPDYNDALSRKKYVDDRDNTKLNLTGGTMTGDITIGNNKIITTSDPTLETHLSRKKYVDDRNNATLQVIYTKSGEKLSLTGGTVTGDITIGNNKIITTSDPTLETHLTRKKYVDIQDAKKLSLTGGRMTGDIIIDDHRIWATSNPTHDRHLAKKIYVDEQITKNKSNTLPNTIANLYSLQMDDKGIFEIKDDIDYIEYTGSNKKIEKLLNLSRKKDMKFTQSDTNKQPLFKKSTINNNFYCIQYLGSNGNNLHLVNAVNILSNQHLNFYFVYGLKSLNSSNNETSLFKITSNETTSQPIPLHFGISYRNSLLYVTNSSRNAVSNSRWQLKANATEINKLICLSIHYDKNNTSGVKQGKLYVNGKEIVSFLTSYNLATIANMKFYLGSKNGWRNIICICFNKKNEISRNSVKPLSSL